MRQHRPIPPPRRTFTPVEKAVFQALDTAALALLLFVFMAIGILAIGYMR